MVFSWVISLIDLDLVISDYYCVIGVGLMSHSVLDSCRSVKTVAIFQFKVVCVLLRRLSVNLSCDLSLFNSVIPTVTHIPSSAI